MPRLPVLDANDLIHALQRAGFEQVRQKGSHARFKHADGRVVTIPIHPGKEIGRGLLRKILRDTEWTIEVLYTFLKK